MMRRYLGLILFPCITSALLAQVPDTLTLEKAVEIALEHQPTLRGAEANIRFANAGAKQARAGLFPSLNFSGSGSHTQGVSVVNPSIPARDLRYDSYTASINANLTIWDFGKTTGRLSQFDYLADAAATDYVSSRENLAVTTQIAYFALLQSIRVFHVAEEALNVATRHLAQAKAFYTVGRRPQLDVTKAEVDLANANVAIIQARNAERVARVQLENVMGVHPSTPYQVLDTLPEPGIVSSLDSSRTIALQSRPELIAAQARVAASQSAVTAAWGQHLPTIGAFGGYTWNGFAFPLASRWNAGVSFSLPIFQGFALDAGVQQAKASADIAQSNYDALRESVLLEVEQQWLAQQETAERIVAASKLVDEAEQNLVLVERQYAAGIATPIEESDAQLTLSSARITFIQAQFDHGTALVRLRRALGLSVIP